MTPVGFQDKVAFVWKVADKLRGTFKQHEYGSVMLPLLVLRRMDAVLAPTKQAVLDVAVGMQDIGEGQSALLKKKAGHRFYNTSPLTFASHSYEDFHLVMPLYVCRRWSGLVQPLEGQELAWVAPVRLSGYPMPPADIPLVAQLRDLL